MSDLLVTAFAAAIGALVLRSALKLVGNYFSSLRALAKYDCAHDGADDDSAAMRHGWGRAVRDVSATNETAWEYTLERPRDRCAELALYGPYVNDFGRPGFYRIRFRISGAGFNPTDQVVVVLDILQTPFDLERHQLIVGQRAIHASELTERYRSFDLVCHTSGFGIFEYRARVARGAVNPETQCLRFDVVRVYRHLPLWDAI